MRHDPLNDIINEIKNSARIGMKEIEITPAARIIGRVLKVMQDYNYIRSFAVRFSRPYSLLFGPT